MTQVGLAILLTGLFVLVSSSPAIGAQSITDLQKRKQALEQKIKADEAAKKKKQEEQVKLDGQIKDLDTQIVGIEERIKETQTNIQLTTLAIRTKEDEIAQKKAELTLELDHQAETLRVIYETGSPSTLELLVGSNTLSEFLTYHDYLDALEGRIERSIEDIEGKTAELESIKTDLQAKESELANLQTQQQVYKRSLSTTRQDKDRLLVNAKAVEQQLSGQITEAQKVYADVNSELSKLMEAARKRAEQRAKGQIPKGVSNVGFQMPVDYRYISTYFGGRTPFQSFHTGLDLVNYSGTPIEASADGVVTTIGRLSYGYGQYVVISHNERLGSLYAHMSEFEDGLAIGQSVKRGDVLGYMGSTGWSTGPHLHFEIREYGVPADPFDYLPS